LNIQFPQHPLQRPAINAVLRNTAVYSENDGKYIKILRGQNAELFSIKSSGVNSYDCALEVSKAKTESAT
jgi:hypothetical protein